MLTGRWRVLLLETTGRGAKAEGDQAGQAPENATHNSGALPTVAVR